eukprot:gnl/TRDRNA2_/TRDRNA2_29733_c0_seq1.p1 gnl/TRDRNA2_/TRDRNA2_29733_c0~~gnl/TRDRNA2_/TRDRNA2_29733_c0_seq1.p1  ORF type:complete len:362 (+),score=99.67 gnl/TRDRNA2_/TRDRNA2_29733_c0_seq1:23-1108(+)
MTRRRTRPGNTMLRRLLAAIFVICLVRQTEAKKKTKEELEVEKEFDKQTAKKEEAKKKKVTERHKKLDEYMREERSVFFGDPPPEDGEEQEAPEAAASASKGSSASAKGSVWKHEKDAPEWPDEAMAQRTTERVSAGKRAAKWIPCEVCQERILDFFPQNGDNDGMRRMIDTTHLEESLSSENKQLCEMRTLAKIFRERNLYIQTDPDGSAKLVTYDGEGQPFYEEINTSDLLFHWKSLAIHQACVDIFRRDGEDLAQAVKQAYIRMAGEEEANDLPMLQIRERASNSALEACQKKSNVCKMSQKMVKDREKRMKRIAKGQKLEEDMKSHLKAKTAERVKQIMATQEAAGKSEEKGGDDEL